MGEPIANSGSRIWIGAALLSLVLLVASGPAYRAVLKWGALDAPGLNAFGVMLGVWGIILGVGGFAITFLQLARTRRAAKAVEAAIVKLKADFGAFDALGELRNARGLIITLSDHLRGAQWASATAGYERLRASLLQVA